MPSPAQVRLAVARKLTEALSSPKLTAIAVVGSVARGLCDDLSDLELLLVWAEPPTETEREAVLRAWSAVGTRRETRPHPWSGVDNVLVRGFQVDLIHHTADSLRELEAGILPEASLYQQEVLANLSQAVVLGGSLQRPTYPEALAAETLRRHVRPLPLGSALLPAVRGDLVRLWERKLRWARELSLALHAANRRFFPGDRGLAETLAQLPHAPSDCASRLALALAEPPVQGGHALHTLLTEALVLAAERVPDWDASKVLQRLPLVLRREWTVERVQRWLEGEDALPEVLSGKTR